MAIDPTSHTDAPRLTKSVWLLAVIIGVALVVGFVLINQINNHDSANEEEKWQSRLSIVADSRVREGSSWLNRHLGAIELLARDPSVQLFADEIAAGDPQGIAEGQRSYVFALLSAEAERSGFHEDRPTDALAANVNRPLRLGIGVFTAAGQLLVGSTGLPNFVTDMLATARDSFIRLGPVLDDGTPLVLFGAPIVGGAGTVGTPSAELGWIIGARPLDASFLDTLTQPGDLSDTGETYVVQLVDAQGQVRMLTPLKGGGRRFDVRTDQAAYEAARTPGAFVEAPNYQSVATLATARDYSAPVDWVLVRSIALSEFNAAAEKARTDLLLNFGLAGVAFLALLVLAWRVGSSARLEAALARQAELAEANKSLSDFLQSIADGQPTAVAVVDRDMTIYFANRKMADLAQKDRDALSAARLDQCFDDKTGSLLRAGASGAAVGEQSLMDVRLPGPSAEKIWRTNFLPLTVERPGLTSPALVVMTDITDLEAAHARSAGTLRQLVSTLTLVIEARDPWSRHHSSRVVDVALAIGKELQLDPIALETLEISGLLVNLGKAFVPASILTKTGKLTDDELAQVHEAMNLGVTLLSEVQFRGPVGPSLAQLREHYDGSGQPDGRKGEDILITARVLAVANAFVAMVAARAHRPTLGFDKAIDALNDGAGRLYDRAVIATLVQIIENKGGRQQWAHFTDPVEEDSILPEEVSTLD